MKEIPLTQGKVALVDDEDFELLNQFNWYAYKNKTGNYYAVRNYSAEKGKRKIILMHREIMDAPKGIQVDHRNGDGLYNQKENLRLATHQQNSFNQRNPHKDNKLGIKGVVWKKKLKKYQAQISINDKDIYLGIFDLLEDASESYRKAEKKYFGEFARNNKQVNYSCEGLCLT